MTPACTIKEAQLLDGLRAAYQQLMPADQLEVKEHFKNLIEEKQQ